MGSLLARAARRLNEPAVRSADGRAWHAPATKFASEFVTTPAGGAPLAIDSPDPLEYAAGAIAALVAGRDIMLCNPQWTASERAAADAIRTRPAAYDQGPPRILIATGGSSGRLRFATHTPDTLQAAAEALHRHCGDVPLNSLCTLPLFHISGFQQLVRALVTDGALLIADWRAIVAGQRPHVSTGDGSWMLSLVPTQLARLLDDDEAVAWLREFDTILLGGAPAGPRLLAEARDMGLPIMIAYGSSETAAAFAFEPIGSHREEEAGLTPFSHATIKLVDPDTWQHCPNGAVGRIAVDADSLFLGYWPDRRPGGYWISEDLGRIDANHRLQLLGRADAAINTGGEKVHPAEIETALRNLGANAEMVVLGIPDARWGECVAAFYPASEPPDITALEEGLRTQLSAHKLPRRWVAVAEWPRTAQGKTDRAALRKLAST